jgi:hypothetical protein
MRHGPSNHPQTLEETMPTDLRRAARTLAVTTFLAVTACAETPTGTLTETPQPAFTETAAGFAVVPLLLRAPDGSDSGAWGNLVVFVGALAPPNPCGEMMTLATVAVCGVIHNPDGELLTGGMLIVQTSRDAAPVTLQFTVPPNPCLTYEVRTVAAPDFGSTGLELPAVQVVFNSESGDIVSFETAPGPPDHPGGVNREPDLPPNPCLISLGGRAGGEV